MIAVEDELAGERFSPFSGGTLAIGRDPASTVRIEERAASWHHCSIAVDEGRCVLRDHQSGSGTFVNGLGVAEHTLEEGDHISVGDTTLVFRTDAAAPLTESPR